MTEYKRIGVDTSKAVFTLQGIGQQDRPVLRVNLRRAQMISFFKKLAPLVIAREACGGSHYWAREPTVLDHTVHLIPPQLCQILVKRSKNDRNEDEAICEAAARPGMRFVPMKSVAQHRQRKPRQAQPDPPKANLGCCPRHETASPSGRWPRARGRPNAQGMLLKVRETLVGQRTLLVNTLRGHATEFGVIAASLTTPLRSPSCQVGLFQSTEEAGGSREGRLV
jgi:transposase